MSDDPYDRIHEVEDFGDLDPDWAGTRVEWPEIAGARPRLLRRDGNPDGPPVVLVHGLGGSASNWLDLMPLLTDIGDVVALDQLGFGESAPPRATSPRPFSNARFLATLVHWLDRGPAVVVGNSLGGLVATLLAGEHPELVRNLVLLGPALPPHLPAFRPTAFQLTAFGPMLVPVVGTAVMRRRIRRQSFAQQVEQSMDGMTSRSWTPPERHLRVGTANLARVRALPWRGRAFREAMAGMFECLVGPARPRTIGAMRAVTADTLYVRGVDDPLVTDAFTRTVRRVRPDWEIVELAGVGHVPGLEAPARVGALIREHVAEASVTRLHVG